MAYQHFYSRVPARVSLYNKTDGFDTFAQSARLTREFVLGELYPIYADKLDKNNPVKIRRSEVPTVYTQAVLPSGYTVQSALTYLPLDYTKERSAYMVHSLVLDNDDRSRMYANPAALSFNPEMFVTDISSFNITSPTSQPIANYPDKPYIPVSISRLSQIERRYNPEMLIRLVFAVVNAVCAGGRDIYIRLPFENKRSSHEALAMVNALLNLLPYNLRERLSFVTYVSHYDNYPGFKLKFVSADCPSVPASRGIFFDFASSTISGMISQPFELNRPLVSFLYSLFDNQAVRDTFHAYVAHTLETYPEKVLDLPTLNELVFLFWQCSGFYIEQSVLPSDDLVYEFFNIYEKYREALSDGYRKQAYKCLERYSLAHSAVPERIFAQLERLYPDDTVPAKRVALTVALKLIHTDVMRDELFKFISDNYDSETPEVKLIINDDLARVFYGGFLQEKIIDFFDKGFDSEPKRTQNAILSKLLLAIRTQSIQEKIVSFLDDHYDALDWDQKLKLYSTAMEMIPECDRLTSMFIWLINRHINKEREALVNAISKQLIEYLSEDYKREYHLLLPLMAYGNGFCDDIIIDLVATHWKDSIVNYEYTAVLDARSSYQKAKKILHIYEIVPDVDLDVLKKFILGARTVLLDTEATLYDYIKLDAELKSKLPDEIYLLVRDNMLYPAAIYSIYDVFNVRYTKDGIRILLDYAENKSIFTDSDQYSVLMQYIDMTRRAEAGDATGVLECIDDFPDDRQTRINISDHIRMCSLNKSTQSAKTAFIYELCINYLKTGTFRFDIVYQQYKRSILSTLEADDNGMSEEKLEKTASSTATELMIECACEMCEAGDDYADIISADTSGFARVIRSFVDLHGIASAVFLLPKINNAPFCIADMIKEILRENIPQPAELIDKIKSSDIISKLNPSEIISRIQESELVSKIQSSEFISKIFKKDD